MEETARALDIDPFSPAVMREPSALYGRLHAGGAFHHAARDIWLVGAHRDVRTVLQQPDTFVSSRGVGYARIAAPIEGGIILASDGAEHARIRGIVRDAFRPEAIARLAEIARQAAIERVAAACGAGPVDAAATIVVPVVERTLRALLGLHEDDAPGLADWSRAGFTGMGPPEQEGWGAANTRFFAGATQLAELLLGGRFEADGLAAVIASAVAAGQLAPDEAVSLFCGVAVAGVHTTQSALCTVLDLLSHHPDAWHAFATGAVTSAQVFAEALRLAPPIYGMFRTTVRPVELGPTALPADARVLLMFGAAGRDPARYTHADIFDPARTDPEHLSFGHGIHVCIGQPLAKVEADALLHALLRHSDGFSSAAPAVRAFDGPVRSTESLFIDFRQGTSAPEGAPT
jgi:cytochrome P450